MGLDKRCLQGKAYKAEGIKIQDDTPRFTEKTRGGMELSKEMDECENQINWQGVEMVVVVVIEVEEV